MSNMMFTRKIFITLKIVASFETFRALCSSFVTAINLIISEL